MLISADSINERSPYKVVQVDDSSVRFSTSFGVRYLVGFYQDVFIFSEGAYYIYVLDENTPEHQDPKVGQTIIAIIQDLFRHLDKSVALYVCARDNNQQATRARLFQIWFTNACFSEQFSLETHHQIDKGEDYFYGLILRKDNPDYDWIIRTFHNFFDKIE